MINSSLFSEREMRGEGNLMEILTVRRQTADLLFVLRNKDYSLLSLSPAPTHASPNGFIREVKISELTLSSM